MKYLNKHKNELFERNKICYRGYVYFANMQTKEIYRMSYDSYLSGNIKDTKYAKIDENWNIVK